MTCPHMTSKGERIDVDVTADGTLVGTEQAADMKTFRKAGRKTLEKATKGIKVVVPEIATTYAEADKIAPTGTKAVKLDKPTVAYDADVGHNDLSAVKILLIARRTSPRTQSKTKGIIHMMQHGFQHCRKFMVISNHCCPTRDGSHIWPRPARANRRAAFHKCAGCKYPPCAR